MRRERIGGEQFVYTSTGYLSTVRDARIARNYRQVLQMDARGQVLRASLGNGTVVSNTYFPATGRPDIQSEQARNNAYAVFYQYHWDMLGNLRKREDVGRWSAHRILRV